MPRGPSSRARAQSADDLDDLTIWLATPGTSGRFIEQAEHPVSTLAGLHTKLPARTVLRDVLRAHRRTQELFRTGRPRLGQARDLLRIDG